MELYPWQQDCLKTWRDNDFRGIVHVVTGAGKTVMAMAAIRLLQESQPFPIQVRVVVPTASLQRFGRWFRRRNTRPVRRS